MTRTLFIESADAIANIANECEGFAEVYADDDATADAEACREAAAWVSSLAAFPCPAPFVTHVPEAFQHTIADAVANLAEYDGERMPGAMWTFEAITDDANRRRIFDAAEGWKDETTTRGALVEAFAALEAVGGSRGALLVLCDLLGQRGCVDSEDRPDNGARDDFLTSVCDVVMRG
jgi:hypothetical protein